MERKPLSFEEVFSDIQENPEFNKADRKIKPYFDILKQVIIKRNERGLTQKELAKLAGTHQSRISRIETAEHDIRLSTLINIAEALDTHIEIKLVSNKFDYELADQLFANIKTNIVMSTKQPKHRVEWQTQS